MEKERVAAPQISIIIPTWNRRDLVVACLESLREQQFQDMEIIVVDDGSADDTVAVLRRDWPGARVLESGRNRGFAAAVNSGIRAARGEWLFLLNNDVTLAPDCLAVMIRVAALSGGDMIAPLILWRDDPDIIYSAGDRIGRNGRPESIGFRQPHAQFRLPDYIFGVCAAAGLYRREIFVRAGMLDESFHAYFEDADLCFRARLAGFRAVLAPQARAWHIGSASISGKTWWRSAQCFRNHALLVIKNMPAALLARHFPAILRERLHQGRMLFSSARTEFGAAGAVRLLFRTAFSLAAALPGAIRARRSIQANRQLDNQKLDKLLD
jgi:GT2 family glycosyltransferase